MCKASHVGSHVGQGKPASSIAGGWCGSQASGRGPGAAGCGEKREVTRKASLSDGISNVVADPVFTVPFHVHSFHALTALPIACI